MEDRIANINMTINNDDDFLSHFCEPGKPLISTELAISSKIALMIFIQMKNYH